MRENMIGKALPPQRLKKEGDEAMETGTVISIAAVLISLIGLIASSRKDTRSDAAASAIIQTKLDSVINGVDDIRVEMRAMRETIRKVFDAGLAMQGAETTDRSLERMQKMIARRMKVEKIGNAPIDLTM